MSTEPERAEVTAVKTEPIGYVRNRDMWLTQLQETGEAHVSGPLGGWFDVGLAVDEIRYLASQLGLDADELEIGAPYVWRLTVRVKSAFAHRAVSVSEQ